MAKERTIEVYIKRSQIPSVNTLPTYWNEDMEYPPNSIVIWKNALYLLNNGMPKKQVSYETREVVKVTPYEDDCGCQGLAKSTRAYPNEVGKLPCSFGPVPQHYGKIDYTDYGTVYPVYAYDNYYSYGKVTKVEITKYLPPDKDDAWSLLPVGNNALPKQEDTPKVMYEFQDAFGDTYPVEVEEDDS